MIHTDARAATGADADLFSQAQLYLACRELGLVPGPELEAEWSRFYGALVARIRRFAFACGAAPGDIGDCVQDVWTELVVRLPMLRLDPERGQFSSWLFAVVRSKVVDRRRSNKRCWLQECPGTLQAVPDRGPNPSAVVETTEVCAAALSRLRQRLSVCSFQVLRLRLIDQKPAAEVAQALGLSVEQVWYRYHRAMREAQKIGSAWRRGRPTPACASPVSRKKTSSKNSAQGKVAETVSRSVAPVQLGTSPCVNVEV
jgi:RNA polymerase sigma factor (sigma-70 family)